MAHASDVIVIGAGIVGVSTAMHLLMRGKKVTLVDRIGAGLETSYGNSGIIENSYVLPFRPPAIARIPAILLDRDPSVRVHYASLPRFLPWIFDFYRNSRAKRRMLNGHLLCPLASDALNEHLTLMRTTTAVDHLTRAGRVKLHRSAASFALSHLERSVATAKNVPFTIYTAEEFNEIEPYVRPVYHKAVHWTSSARLTDPGAVTRAYVDRFVREGGEFRIAAVNALNRNTEGNWAIAGNGDVLTAPKIVVSTGPWANDLLASLGYRFPLAFKRGYHRHFLPRDGATLSHALVDADIGYLMCPMEQGYRITTGVEFVGRDDAQTPVQLERVMPFARQLFPLADATDAPIWYGNRPCFTDSLPVIGQAPRHQGLWFNFGHGHSGLTIGPASGRLLAEMLTDRPTFCDPKPYRADRFGV